MLSVVPKFDFDAIRGIQSFKEKNWPVAMPLIPSAITPIKSFFSAGEKSFL